jgi:hypothetical protein
MTNAARESRVTKIKPFCYFLAMNLAEVQKQALALSENERAQLAASLLETLPPEVEISDEEVLQRDADLDSGRADEISHEEFVRRVEQERRR